MVRNDLKLLDDGHGYLSLVCRGAKGLAVDSDRVENLACTKWKPQRWVGKATCKLCLGMRKVFRRASKK